MRYRSEYPHAYEEGVINKSVTLSRVAYDLLSSNEIDNQSAFINDLIIDALQEKDYFKKKLLSQINADRQRLEKSFGVTSEFKVLHGSN